MKQLFILLAILPGVMNTGNGKIVYISTGPRAYAYHVRLNCPRLSRCRQEGHWRTISFDDAIRMKRKPCGTCAK